MFDGRYRRVVLALTDEIAARSLHQAINADSMEVVGVAHDGIEALEAIRRTTPDAVLADMILPAIDGCELIQRIRSMPLSTMPVMVLFSVGGLDRLDRLALESGAYKVFHKPVDMAEVLALIRGADIVERLPRMGVTKERVNELLWSLGLPAKLNGSSYLCTAIMLASEDGRLTRELTTRLYPMVADRHGTDAKSVERSMRRAIESAWSAGALEAQHALFGNTIDARRGKPTCGEMIARIADLLRSKE